MKFRYTLFKKLCEIYKCNIQGLILIIMKYEFQSILFHTLDNKHAICYCRFCIHVLVF